MAAWEVLAYNRVSWVLANVSLIFPSSSSSLHLPRRSLSAKTASPTSLSVNDFLRAAGHISSGRQRRFSRPTEFFCSAQRHDRGQCPLTVRLPLFRRLHWSRTVRRAAGRALILLRSIFFRLWRPAPPSFHFTLQNLGLLPFTEHHLFLRRHLSCEIA